MLASNSLLKSLGLSLAISLLGACSIGPKITSGEVTQYPAKDRKEAVLLAQQALDAKHYQEAEQQFLPLTDSGQALEIRQLALTGLVLVYLDTASPRFDIDRAIDTMDLLNAALNAQPKHRMQFTSLRLLLEQTISLKQVEAQRLSTAQDVIRLQAQVNNLEAALERLRRLSLQ